MKYSEIKKIILALKGNDAYFLTRIDIPFAVENIEFFDTEDDDQFDALCDYVYYRYEEYLNNGGKADAYDFCCAIEMNFQDKDYDVDASFKEKIKFLKELDWAEVGRDADEILQNF